MAVIIVVAKGPMTNAASGVPTGWDEEPVTGTGICHTDITKTTAPIRETLGRYDGSSLIRFFIIRKLRIMKIRDIANQNKIQCISRIPSEMCRLASPKSSKLDFTKVYLI